MENSKCLNMEEYQKKSCKWSLNSTDTNPHRSIRNEVKKIYNNVTEFIGNTPMIKLNKIPKKEGIKCEILAKCEFYNPGGSTKDRIGLRMIQELEMNGKINEETTLIEATSGNTGIGLAMVGASKGYKVNITLPEKMSQEKSDVLNALGAKIYRTPTEAPFDSHESHIGVAIKLNKEINNSCIPDQYINTGNALAHYDGTAEEIWEQCDGKIDYVIVSAGTGGTLTGIGRKLKEKNPNIQIIGVDPKGSILALPDELNLENLGKSYKVEGTGYDFIPKNCDREIADKWIKTGDKETFYYARRLIKEEGLLVGGSSGSVMYAALQIAKDLPEDKRVVCIFVDSVRNYMTKFLNDDWMIENKFIDQDEIDKDLKAVGGEDELKKYLNKFTEVTPVKDSTLISEVLKLLNEKTPCLPVSNSEGEIVGIITLKIVKSKLMNMLCNKDSPIRKIMQKDYKSLNSTQPTKYLSKAFLRHDYVVVTHEKSLYIAKCEDLTDLLSL